MFECLSCGKLFATKDHAESHSCNKNKMKTNLKSLNAGTLTELTDAYEVLKAYISHLPEKDTKFAQDMLKAYEKPGHGTYKQQLWLKKKAEQAQNLAKKAGDYVGGPTWGPHPDEAGPVSASFTGFQKIYAMLQHGATVGKVTNPKITLKLADDSGLLLYISGKNSKKPGVINITDGGPYGANKWYGRIYPDGKWEQPKSYIPKIMEGKDIVHSMLHALATDPLGVAGNQSSILKKCCFCGKKFTEEFEGTSCAIKYGLTEVELGHKDVSPKGTLSVDEGLEWGKAAKEAMSLGELLSQKINQSLEDSLKEKETPRIKAPVSKKKVDYLF